MKNRRFNLHVKKWKDGCGSKVCDRAQHICYARGKIPADLLFIGEWPGGSEDKIGQPFVGPAGHILQEWIDLVVPERVRYCMTNLMGCMPREGDTMQKSHKADKKDILACQPRLMDMIQLCNPKLIICVGTIPRDYLNPKAKHGLKLPKRIKIVDIIHPAAILRANTAAQTLLGDRAILQISNAVEDFLGEV
jgi:DNA polymerase